MDVTGREVTKTELVCDEGVNHFLIDNLDNLSSGVYFLRITSDGATASQKIIKQ
jgi:hypothetical protein